MDIFGISSQIKEKGEGRKENNSPYLLFPRKGSTNPKGSICILDHNERRNYRIRPRINEATYINKLT